MKKFLLTILLSVLIPVFPSFAEEDIITNSETEVQTEKFDTEKLLNNLLKTAEFFDKQYPKEKINEDMRDDIKNAFPGISEQGAYDLQMYIRNGLGAYRYFKNLYEKYKESLLTPEEPAIIVDDDQIADFRQAPDYIDSGEEAVIISDIKTIVPYTLSNRDRKAVEAKILRDSYSFNKKGEFDELIHIASRIKLVELPFYDILYPSPLTGKKGIGEWQKTKNAYVRIITEQTGIKDAKSIRGLVHFSLPDNRMIIGIDGLHNRPKINFEKSENLKNWQANIPVPTRIIIESGKDYSGFFKELAIPITFEVEDTEKPLILKSEISVDICDENFKCSTETFNPELTLNSEYKRESSVATFIYQRHMNIPQEKSEYINIDSVKIKNLPDIGDFIEVALTASEKISDFDIFISNADNIAFETPRINIDGKKITVRFLPISQDKKLEEHDFEFSILLNSRAPIRTNVVPITDNQPDEKPHLSLKLLILGFIGGLLLNLMPCVFPVLSIKLLSLTKFGARQNINIRRNFRYTLIGIFISMFMLASFLATLKYLGHNIGWGMQFQNPYFVIIMVFAVMLFILTIFDVVHFKTPKWLQKQINTSNPDNVPHLLTGVMVVLMATPCTAPYLGTAIGFALAGTIVDIYCVLLAVGLGLAFPYILIYLFPNLIILIPTPGPWMKKLNSFMTLALFLTLIWLISILQVQTNTWYIIRLSIYLIIGFFALWLNSLSNENYDEGVKGERQKQIKRKFNIIFYSIFTLFFIIALVDGGYNHSKHYEEVKKQTVDTINYDEINKHIKEGKTVIVAVGADWCLTCKYNNVMVLEKPSLAARIKNSPNIEFIKVDWTNYDKQVLMFMEKYKRSGLPFYILFSPLAPDGIVLPEILSDDQLNRLISNFTVIRSNS
ncbi:MAG: thioredoxin family protein [Alphaproteobacteria bacterium]|nr:thioredoxin family protein [Alphaproteobacteria bacterium]